MCASETFLPFHLEYAFSSALLLLLLEAIVPTYVTEQGWLSMSLAILDNMSARNNVAAQLRKSELQHLEQLLHPVRQTSRHLPAQTTLSSSPAVIQRQQNLDADTDMAFPGVSESNFDAGLFETSWETLFGPGPMAANHEQIVDLAEQFDVPDLNSFFLFNP